ncbi:hypothetical protein J2Z79_000783 [Symbiobacterium terraclitae]|uniref:DUF4350 domain-containing protein n=1 Tax=Symbiobacterium terraclitae TaxID=557451 RepID=A0ABS4JR24_9FIRM|nr:DUF4350 domain-containing protein [Symbiobacterium terraclitae]MBP2017400.1 hypothetical protein [Symbiobacterium terraclitae]
MARGGCRIKKPGRDAWPVIAGLIALIFVGTLLGGGSQARSAMAPAGSTYSRSPDGLSAIYAVFADQRAALRWKLPLDRLDDDVDRLVIWNVEGLRPEEVEALERWVARGHAALVGGDLTNPPAPWPGTIDPGVPGSARPAAAHPATAGIREVSVGGAHFRGGSADQLVHLKDAGGRPVLVSWRVGEGRLFWSADTAWLSNARIGEAQNLELALQTLMPRGGGQVAFDEYHHGYTSPTHWWQLLRESLRAFALLMAAALTLFFWSFGVRFGSPLPAPVRPPRAAVEYVHSMSQLYRRAGAGEVVLRALYRSLRAHLGRLTGGVADLSHAEIARRAAPRCGAAEAEIERLLNRTADSNLKPSEAELIALARDVENLQRRIDHAGHRDR